MMLKEQERHYQWAQKLTGYLPTRLSIEMARVSPEWLSHLNEIRLRIHQPVVLMSDKDYRLLGEHTPLTGEEIREIFEKMCDYSVYSRQNELSRGYLLLPGGHRVGVCGSATTDNSGRRTLRNITSFNIRVANEFLHCADKLLQACAPLEEGLLIAGPPCCGKTTLLRDIALSLSSPPSPRKVVVVDERGELAGMYQGEPQHTLGLFCDVLNGYPKGEGILNAVRTLSPDVIICDEIGAGQEIDAIREGLNSGICFIASIHCRNADELYRKPQFQKLRQSGAFHQLVLLKGDGRCAIDEIRQVPADEA